MVVNNCLCPAVIKTLYKPGIGYWGGGGGRTGTFIFVYDLDVWISYLFGQKEQHGVNVIPS